MPATTQLNEKNKAKKMLAWALTDKLETPTADGTLDLPGYKIIDTLGTGGMGSVYRAKHLDLGRTVALKIFTPQSDDHDLFVERLKREGKLMAELEHPNVLSIYDAAVLDDGTPYLVLEYVQGEDLQKKLMREGKLSQRTALHIAIKVCEALSAVHKIGIIHRDIKPANVLLDRNGAVKVTDFGISKDTRSDDSRTSLTMTGTTVGTADYMSPEQTTNEELSSRSDLYSVGVLLYEMLMGVTPRGNFEALSKHGVPKNLEYIIMRCLQRDRQKRPASANTLARSLKKIYNQVNTRRHHNYKAITLYALGAVAATCLVLFISIRGNTDTTLAPNQPTSNQANISSALTKKTPIPLSDQLTESEQLVIGSWENFEQNYSIQFKQNRTVYTSFEKINRTGVWESSRHGGYFLRFNQNPTDPSATAEFFHLDLDQDRLHYRPPHKETITLFKVETSSQPDQDQSQSQDLNQNPNLDAQ